MKQLLRVVLGFIIVAAIVIGFSLMLDDSQLSQKSQPGVISVNEKPSQSPKLLRKVEPIYPEAARKDKAWGDVIIFATTDENGDVKDVKVIRSAHPLLDQAAVDAVKQWLYEPFIVDGKPQPVRFTVTFHFASPREGMIPGLRPRKPFPLVKA